MKTMYKIKTPLFFTVLFVLVSFTLPMALYAAQPAKCPCFTESEIRAVMRYVADIDGFMFCDDYETHASIQFSNGGPHYQNEFSAQCAPEIGYCTHDLHADEGSGDCFSTTDIFITKDAKAGPNCITAEETCVCYEIIHKIINAPTTECDYLNGECMMGEDCPID